MAQVVDANAGSTQAAASVTGTHLTLLGWGVLLASLYGLNHTGTGHEVIFYSLVLIALFMFAANYKRILPLLTKGGQ